MKSENKANSEDFQAAKDQFSNLFGTFGANPTLEQSGVIVPYPLDSGGVMKVKLRRAGLRNTEWKRSYNATVKPHEARIQSGEITENEMQSLLAVVYADAVVIGWTGIKDKEGKEVPYSKEMTIKLLTFFPDLFSMIIASAHDRANFQEADLEQTEKN